MATTPFKVGGSGNQSHSHSHNQRGKPYVLMLILAFGAAILGVMVLHKLRERRIFSTLVKQKDHELLTLHLLLQREQEFNKQARKKIEEMKTKVYSLRSRKLELDRRLSEMESTISTLRDERKVIESALEEKNEIKMLTGGDMNSSSELVSQVNSLKEIIKMKEAEIEDLRHQLQNPVTTSSTSNSTKDERKIRNESITQKENGHTINGEARELRDGESVLIGRDENAENKMADSQSNQGLKIAEKKANETSTGLDGETGDQENQGYTSFSRGGLMLEKSEFEHGLGSRGRRRHSKGKRWRDSVRNRRLGQSLYSVANGMAALNRDNSDKATKSTAASDEYSKKFALSDKWNRTGETGVDTKPRQEDAKMVEDPEQSTSVNEEQDTNENVKPKLVSGRKRVIIAGIAGIDRKQKSGKKSSRLKDQEASRMAEKMQSTDLNKHENDDEQGNSGEKEAPEAEEEDAETLEPDIDRADVQRFSESDHEDETEETEF